MAALGGALIGLFLLYFLFMFVAQFLIGQLLIFFGALYLGYFVYNLCLDFEKPKRIYKIITILISGLLVLAYVAALNSESYCDGYYIGKVFKSGYGPEQNGATVTIENYSNICGYPGFSHACRQFEECRRGTVVLKPLQLFVFGLLCASIGSVLGLIKIGKIDSPKVTESQNLAGAADGTKIELNESSKQLKDHWRENKDKFENSTLSYISKNTGYSERAIKTFITKNKLYCTDYGVKKPNQ
jgi:hypothetical protein